MNWTPPTSNEEWAEILSAYLDGELTPDEVDGVEHHLHAQPELSQRLSAMRVTRETLREWKVDRVTPDAAFALALENRAATRRTAAKSVTATWRQHSLFRWSATAAVFACGVLCGVYGTLSAQHPATTTQQMQEVVKPAAPARETTVALASAISPTQAQALFREMEAEKIKDQLMGQLRNRDWTAAATLRRKLQTNYADTRAGAGVTGDRNVELLDKALANTRRTNP